MLIISHECMKKLLTCNLQVSNYPGGLLCNEQLTVCPAILDKFHQCSQYHKYFYKVEYGELWITAVKLAGMVSDVASLYSKYLPLNKAECSKAVKWQFPAEWLLS